jgi:hypothetical protein
MKGVPGGPGVLPGLGTIAVFAKSVADAHLVIPDGLEILDQVSLGRVLPGALDDEIPAFEILNGKILSGCDASLVIAKPVG